MAIPLHVRQTLLNVLWTALGRRERTAYHPLAVCYLVTYRCELRCAYCLENVAHRCPGGEPQELDAAGAIRVLRAVRPVCDMIDISGGEPLLRPDLPRILAACRDLGFREVMLNTNGLHFEGDPDYLDDVDCVTLGIDTLDGTAFTGITGGTPGQHRRQLAALESLRRLQKPRRFDLVLCSVILPGRLDETEAILDWCLTRDVGLSVSPYIGPDLRVAEELRRDPRFGELCERLVAHRRRGRPLVGTLGYYETLRDLGPFHCLPMSNLTINPMGEMFWPCGEIQRRGPSFLEGKSFRRMVDEARGRLGPLPECRDRCHFICRLPLSDLVARPLRLLAEARHDARCRPHVAARTTRPAP